MTLIGAGLIVSSAVLIAFSVAVLIREARRGNLIEVDDRLGT